MNTWYIALLSIIPILFAITIHEVAHGWMAKKCGDNTAYSQGRITLNPISHIDIIGTIIVPFVCNFLTGFMFGWAKPVPVTFSNLKNIRKDGIKVILAGPLSNLLMAIGWSLIMSLCSTLNHFIDMPVLEGLIEMSYIGVKVNIVFFIFNLLPIPPLDGGRILQLVLPPKFNESMSFLEEYGIFIVMLLALTGVLSHILNPIIANLEFLLIIPSIISELLIRAIL